MAETATNLNEDVPLDDESRRRRDPELLAMERAARHLEDLDGPARARAVAWLEARFCPRPTQQNPL